MITITEKQSCCGCMACVQKCPKQCIHMKEDNEGFLYPAVDLQTCVDCHLCEKVCPVLNQSDAKESMHVYAARNLDPLVVKNSSSGGIFSLVAEKILSEGGVVFGVGFNEKWEVCHMYIEEACDMYKLQGSKYVQSRIGTSYIDAENFLKQGRKVLFSGTPCQIAGLHRYLRKDFDNLFCLDVICHGSPSPGIWRDYLKEITERPKGVVGKNSVLSSLKEKPFIAGISFRDKSDGWKKYGFVIRGMSAFKADKNTVLSSVNTTIMKEPASQNLFMRGFLHNLYLRPSCYNCPARQGKSGSDLLLGDFWGILRRHPEFHDPMGVSLVLTYTEKGQRLFDSLTCAKIDATYDDALDCNINIEKDEPMPHNRNGFFEDYSRKGIRIIDKYCKQLEPSRHTVFWNKVKSKLSRIIKK